jgi:phosphoribosyl-dephospho-CoA transferase
VAETFSTEILRANNEELRRQRDALQTQVDELIALVRAFPGQLTAARLDAKEGRQTVYNYKAAERACAVRR